MDWKITIIIIQNKQHEKMKNFRNQYKIMKDKKKKTFSLRNKGSVPTLSTPTLEFSTVEMSPQDIWL